MEQQQTKLKRYMNLVSVLFSRIEILLIIKNFVDNYNPKSPV